MLKYIRRSKRTSARKAMLYNSFKITAECTAAAAVAAAYLRKKGAEITARLSVGAVWENS